MSSRCLYAVFFLVFFSFSTIVSWCSNLLFFGLLQQPRAPHSNSTATNLSDGGKNLLNVWQVRLMRSLQCAWASRATASLGVFSGHAQLLWDKRLQICQICVHLDSLVWRVSLTCHHHLGWTLADALGHFGLLFSYVPIFPNQRSRQRDRNSLLQLDQFSKMQRTLSTTAFNYRFIVC